MSVPSLHRESSNSLILYCILLCPNLVSKLVWLCQDKYLAASWIISCFLGQNPGMCIFKHQHTTPSVVLDTLVVDVKVSGLYQNHDDFPMMYVGIIVIDCYACKLWDEMSNIHFIIIVHSCLHLCMSKWWNMLISKYVFMCPRMDGKDMFRRYPVIPVLTKATFYWKDVGIKTRFSIQAGVPCTTIINPQKQY